MPVSSGSAFVHIDYDEGVRGSYRGVIVTLGGEEIARFSGGGPQRDWADYLAWKDEGSWLLMEASSVTHFLWDEPGWKMILDERDREIIVPDDRPPEELAELAGG